MAVTFIEQRKKQKYLIIGFLAIIVVTLIVLWLGYFRKEKPPSPISVRTYYKEIKIDFTVLESPLLKEFQPFGEITPFEAEKGRGNPFLLY